MKPNAACVVYIGLIVAMTDYCVSYRDEFEYMQFCSAAMPAISNNRHNNPEVYQLKYTFVAVAFKQVPVSPNSTFHQYFIYFIVRKINLNLFLFRLRMALAHSYISHR